MAIKTYLQERLLWEACRAGDAVKARELLTSELGAVNFDWANPTFHVCIFLYVHTHSSNHDAIINSVHKINSSYFISIRDFL